MGRRAVGNCGPPRVQGQLGSTCELVVLSQRLCTFGPRSQDLKQDYILFVLTPALYAQIAESSLESIATSCGGRGRPGHVFAPCNCGISGRTCRFDADLKRQPKRSTVHQDAQSLTMLHAHAMHTAAHAIGSHACTTVASATYAQTRVQCMCVLSIRQQRERERTGHSQLTVSAQSQRMT